MAFREELARNALDTQERVYRDLDKLALEAAVDQRALRKARDRIREGFMWLSDAIMPPERIHLGEDDEPAVAPPPIYIGPVYRHRYEAKDARQVREKVTDNSTPGEGRELVAEGANWYYKDEYQAYIQAVNKKREEVENVKRTGKIAKANAENAG